MKELTRFLNFARLLNFKDMINLELFENLLLLPISYIKEQILNWENFHKDRYGSYVCNNEECLNLYYLYKAVFFLLLVDCKKIKVWDTKANLCKFEFIDNESGDLVREVRIKDNGNNYGVGDYIVSNQGEFSEKYEILSVKNKEKTLVLKVRLLEYKKNCYERI